MGSAQGKPQWNEKSLISDYSIIMAISLMILLSIMQSCKRKLYLSSSDYSPHDSTVFSPSIPDVLSCPKF